MRQERIIGWLLVAVLAVAFGLRLWMALTLPRYFDDHYVFNNITPFLNGSLKPRHSYYGSLSYLPQAIALAVCDYFHSLTGMDALAVRGTYTEGFSLVAFRIMRMFIILYSLISILMIYFVGRRLFSPAVGLAAAAVLAAYPQHVRSAIQLKPDMMALMFTVITLYWTAGAARNPRLSRFLLAGVGVGLATSAKYIGVSAALPLAVWALWTGFRDRRRWAWLALAGISSVVTFFALNPYADMVFRFGKRLVKFYGNRARGEGSNRLTVVRGELDFLADQHGWILGALLLLGTVLLIRQLRREPEDGARAMASLPLILFFGYPALYAAGMTLFRTHNLLPVLAGTALVCAFAMVRCGQWLLRARVPAVLLWLLPGAFLLIQPFTYTYAQLVPGTWIAAEKDLRVRLAPLGSRQVAHEPPGPRLRLAEGWRRSLKIPARNLATRPPSSLDLADAEAFPLARTEGDQGAFYQDRRRRAQGCVQEIHPRPFRYRGAPLLLLLHPWQPAGRAAPIALDRSSERSRDLIARLPDGLTAGEVLSFELLRPASGKPLATVRLEPGGQSLPLEFTGRRRVKARYLTPRFRYTAGTTGIRLPASARVNRRRLELRLWRWSPAACPDYPPAMAPTIRKGSLPFTTASGSAVSGGS